MLPGVLFALAAGGLWGMIFVVPLIVPDYPGLLQSAGRNVAFGLIALPFAWRVQRQLRMLLPKDWLEALKLTLVGNLLYYGFLASAIQQTGAPVSTMIIGILPVTISITANLCYGHLEGRLRWQRLTPALFLILVGLLCVNLDMVFAAECALAAESSCLLSLRLGYGSGCDNVTCSMDRLGASVAITCRHGARF